MKVLPMILRFCSGSVTPARRSRKVSRRVDVMHRQLQLLVALDHLLRFVQAQQAVVDEDALQAIADGAVDDRGGDGRIDAARQAAHDAAVADLRLDARRGFVDERGDGPVAGAAADVEREVPQQLLAAIGVRDFGVEQQRVVAALRRFHHRDRRVVAGRGDRESRRRRGDEVAVARPHLHLVGHALQHPRRDRRVAAHQRMAELAMRGAAERAAEHVGHQLHAVADAERRHAEVEHGAIAVRRALFVDAARAAGQDDADRLLGLDRVERGVERQDLAVDRQLAQTARDQLGKLRAEIQDEDGLMGHDVFARRLTR